MGFAKYHEDNIKIFEDRMYYKNTSLFFPCVRSTYVPKHIYKFQCPFCRSGYDSEKQIANHVMVNHGGKTRFIYLNNRRVYNQIESAKCIYSLTLYCFDEKPMEVRICDDFDRKYTFWTQSGNFEYNIQNYIKDNLFSNISIHLNDEEYCFKQLIDINVVSIDKILTRRYVSDLFYEQISEEMFSPKEYLSFLKMLINENRDTSDVMIRIEMMNFDWNEDTKQLYWYHYLASEQEDMIPRNEISVLRVVRQILTGDLIGAKTAIDNGAVSGNDKAGCLLMIGLLLGESLTVKFQKELYTPTGILGNIVRVLEHLYFIESNKYGTVDIEIDEISVFQKYPLIAAVIELEKAINRGGDISKGTYEMLRGLSPLATITYCRGIDDELAREKIIKSTSKIHEESTLLKRLAVESNYDWIYRRLAIKDGNIYKEAVRRENERAEDKLSNYFIDTFPLNDEIVITPLGGEATVGASCFVVSYHGINIMLDCGVNPYKKGEEAYPALDDYTKQIDYIFISHAHIDHSGALVKAHAMWPTAKIYMTDPTRIFAEYLFSDMAKVHNGINNEFEIDIVEIEKDIMIDTVNSINTIGYMENIALGEKLKVKFHPAGHIQGASMIEIKIDDKTLLYTGDFAAKDQVLTAGLQYKSLPQNVDYLITESTYVGKKIEDKSVLVNELQNRILDCIRCGKSVILPAMAVGRSQELACIVGTMKLEGLIDADIDLYLAGMAIPTTTQIIPFMNESYAEVIGQFNEFDGYEYPKKRSIVIASSASMTKGSASYKIAKHWKDSNVNFEIMYVSAIDSRTEQEMNQFGGGCVDMTQYSLPTHSDEEGIKEIIRYTKPRVISFVHEGKPEVISAFSKDVRELFDNDVIIKQLIRKKSVEIFNLYDLIKEDDLYEDFQHIN